MFIGYCIVSLIGKSHFLVDLEKDTSTSPKQDKTFVCTERFFKEKEYLIRKAKQIALYLCVD